jgi:hypothetical protein
VGDWVCIKCKNLNFSFRVVCNRCQLPKAESDKMFESYMGNLMNYVKINEMMQQRIIQNNQYSPPGYVNNNSININNNYYGNAPQGAPLQGKNIAMNRHGVPFSGNGANFYNSGMGMGNFGNVSNNGSVSGIPFQDWGLGIGDWGLGPIPNPQSPIPILIYFFLYLNLSFQIVYPYFKCGIFLFCFIILLTF